MGFIRRKEKETANKLALNLITSPYLLSLGQATYTLLLCPHLQLKVLSEHHFTLPHLSMPSVTTTFSFKLGVWAI